MTTSSAHKQPRPHASSSPKSSTSAPTASHHPSTAVRETILVNSADSNGSAITMARSGLNGMVPDGQAQANGQTSRFRTVSNSSPDGENGSNDDDDGRSSTAARRRKENGSTETRDDIHSERLGRPTKPVLQRSKSEFGGRRPSDDPEITEDAIVEWGARHGFEDHYQSEQISQLANVSICQ